MVILGQLDYLKPLDYDSYVRIRELSEVIRAINKFSHESNLSPDKCRVVDLGCGLGGISIPLARLGYNVVAVDVDPASIVKARRLCYSLANIKFVEKDVFQYLEAEPHATFHVAVCSHVLDHVTDPCRLINLTRRVLLKQGILIVVVLNALALSEVLYFKPKYYFNRFFRPRRINMHKEHIQAFTLGRLSRVLRNNSFLLESVTGIGSVLSINSMPFLKGTALSLLELAIPKPLPLAWSWVAIARRS